jgi:CPA2 family monovalent cation:H+ antiporter-2
MVVAGLTQGPQPILVIDDHADHLGPAAAMGVVTIAGNAADPRVLEAAGIARASRLLVAIPEGFEAGQVVTQARTRNPDLLIVARAASSVAASHLAACGADRTILAEHELANAMLAASAAAT